MVDLMDELNVQLDNLCQVQLSFRPSLFPETSLSQHLS